MLYRKTKRRVLRPIAWMVAACFLWSSALQGLAPSRCLAQGGTPPPPSNLAATGQAAQIHLSWTSNGGDSYHVKRGTATGGPYTETATPTGTTYADTTVQVGTRYYYVVTAQGAGGESGNSNEANAVAGTGPPAPTNLAAVGGGHQINLTWTNNGGMSFNVKRAEATGGPYTQLANVTANSFVDSTPTAWTVYYYVATAVGMYGLESNPSNEDSAWANDGPQPGFPERWQTGQGNAPYAQANLV